MSNPFNDRLDWTFQGKRCRVYGQDRVYEGWVNRIHHSRGSVILHDAVDVTGGVKQQVGTDDRRKLGSVFVRVAEHIEEVEAGKHIEGVSVKRIVDSPWLDVSVTPTDYHMRRAYRNGFAGSFPVVRPVALSLDEVSDESTEVWCAKCGRQVNVEGGEPPETCPGCDRDPEWQVTFFEIINGHKRVEAMRRTGVETHPVEIIEVDDETAEELFYLAHREHMHDADDESPEEPDDEQADLESAVTEVDPDE